MLLILSRNSLTCCFNVCLYICRWQVKAIFQVIGSPETVESLEANFGFLMNLYALFAGDCSLPRYSDFKVRGVISCTTQYISIIACAHRNRCTP